MLPNRTTAPDRKLLPEIVTVVPPSIEPLFGKTLEMVGAEFGDTLKEKPVDEEAPVASRTCAVKGKLPEAVGVPAIVPAFALNCRPAGSAPLVALQVYGGVPPLAASVAE